MSRDAPPRGRKAGEAWTHARSRAAGARLATRVASLVLVFAGFALVLLIGAATIAGVSYELFRR